MTWIFAGMIIISVVFALFTGRIEQVSQAAIGEASSAVELCLALMGTICFWNGLMKVADKAGLTEKISRLFSPVTKRLFKDLKSGGAAMKMVCMNMSANLLGLGNAATPLGIAAMREMENECGASESASNAMIMFVVLNTASLQLIPTTVAALRLKNGSANPFDILPAVWVSSIASVASGVIAVKLFEWLTRRRKQKEIRHSLNRYCDEVRKAV
ncbi:nucleoside recognition domain-containing protein [Candidatus Soleaferrea massiliensis]|uniref:nucleoside recognition domain-containing protein n=1 Tax=Candidatus Soleaferrea massiliensis TaxID=1470354 RepID=UPI0006941DDC|nr:nucleoside recognition domain-containing protein [Candidatus Soleaferrea massiliensis]